MSRNTPIPHLPEIEKSFVRKLVLAETDDMIVFDKPAGLPCQTRGNRGRNLDQLLWAFARSNGKRPRLVHRLDTGTSGVIVAANTKPAAARLSTAFEARTIGKVYIAQVEGIIPNEDRGVIDVPIGRLETDRGMQIVAGVKDGKSARTNWRVLRREDGAALFELKPLSGRTHQIRVHLAHIGCPIQGDKIYGDGESAGRMMLHAWRLSVPAQEGALKTFEAPVPSAFHLYS